MFIRSSISKVSHVREIKKEVITTLNIAHLLHFSHYFPNNMDACVPRNQALALTAIQKQPFPLSH